MARIVRLTNLTQAANNTPALRLEDPGDTLFLGAGATIAASGAAASAIFLVEGNNDLVIRGAVYSADGSGISGNLNIPFGGSRVEIGEGGSASGHSYGVNLLGDDNEVFNAGEVLAGIDGIRASGANSVVVNLGTVRAHNQGVEVGLGGTVTNAGEIFGDQEAVVLGAGSILRNEGVIAGVQPAATGVLTSGPDITIHNHGRIVGLEAAAIRFEGGTPSGLNTLLNTGTIEAVGSAFAVIAGDAIEQVENAGRVIGGISLGAGADLYDGRLGQVLRGAVNGDAGEDTLLGGAVHDRLVGGASDDEIVGAAGDDTVEGGNGGDLMAGGEGFDMLLYVRSYGGVSVNLGNGATAGGEAQGDIITGFEAVSGSVFADTLTGSAEANLLLGGSGNDVLDGGVGDDRLVGSTGRDVLIGGLGGDVLFGGAGNDVFTFHSIADSTINPAGRDRIRDFNQLEGDSIDLARIDANVNTAADDAFAFIGFAGFSGTAGELRMQATDAHLLVSGDTDGNGVADFAVLLRGALVLQASDFVL